MSDLARRALELAEKATPGPWGIDGSDSTNWGVRSVADDQPIISAMTRARGTEAEPDAEFIAFARSALPALAERVLALEGELEGSVSSTFHLGVEKELQAAQARVLALEEYARTHGVHIPRVDESQGVALGGCVPNCPTCQALAEEPT